MNCLEFENRLQTNLENCGINLTELVNSKSSIGVAVSGGADSVCLLICLSEILKKYKLPLYVITVNHFIRSEEETCGDVDFVKNLCEKLCKNDFDVRLTIKNLKPGQVQNLCLERKSGIEEAARFLRYQFFNEFISENKLKALCIAHNQNDQLETLLMRFLQGNFGNSLIGIQSVRENYVRPLLSFTRDEIEEYLNKKNISWRTDSTNLNPSYLRNKIRLKLVPLLNQEFINWDKALLSGIQKNLLEKQFVDDILDNTPLVVKKDSVSVSFKEFSVLHDFLKIKLLLKMFNLCGESSRVPYAFLQDFINSLNGKKISKKYGDFTVVLENENLYVKKDYNLETDFSFFDIIKEDGQYEFSFGNLQVKTADNQYCKLVLKEKCLETKAKLPFCIRSFVLQDEILLKDGNLKKISDIFSSWHVPEEVRFHIPVIQNLGTREQEIVCILGEELGFYNWIVK